MRTPEERISYAVICEQMPIPHSYFRTYEEAVDSAKFDQPAYRPYYIVERVEHFEICGIVRDEVEDEPDEPYDLDCGFDPYLGCYTDDC